MMLHTRLCDVLGVESPILVMPLPSLYNVTPELAAAISEAGGFGVCEVNGNPSQVRQAIQQIRALTQKPFGMGFSLGLYQDAHIAVCIEEKVSAIAFILSDPSPSVEMIHAAGIKVIFFAKSVEDAVDHAYQGVDVLVVPVQFMLRVFYAVSLFPVAAICELADVRSVVAALVLGAKGVALDQHALGSSPEATVHELLEDVSTIIQQGLNVFLPEPGPDSPPVRRGE